MNKINLVTAASLFAAIALPASATCSGTDTIGTWRLYSASANYNGAYWTKCTLVVTQGGKIGGASTCSNSAGQSTGVTGSVVLTAPASCMLKGSVRYTLGGAVSTVNEATMSEDKKSVAGVGTFSGGGFLFTMMRIN
jgi:hypothetical protein